MLERSAWFLAVSSPPAASAPSLTPVRSAMAMFILIAVVLGTFLALLVAMALIHRVRRRQENENQKAAEQPTMSPLDPWSEAARRVQPFDSRDERA